MVAALALIGAVVGLIAGLLTRRTYASSATFIPQDADANLSGLALAASQFNVKLPSVGGAWGPAVYVELLQSPVLLEPIAGDTLTVAELGNQRTTLMDLLKIRGASQAEKLERAEIALRQIITARELRSLNAVELTVRTHWPSVSATIARQLVDGVNRFNVTSRRTQASAEREFIEQRAEVAAAALRAAEERLATFLRQNRMAVSPELSLERDRLQREVNLQQQLYTTLLQSREEARAREVRDTPVITILEAPRTPVLPESRRTLLKAVLGMLGFGLLGVLFAVVSDGVGRTREMRSDIARDFLTLLDDATPNAIRKMLRRSAARTER
jgi:uncharacterized protein involved in exopolysaccharide biosynthesis